ncbi:MAG: hypothetical protein V9G12_01575 [Microthrixaceae bacterium]
MYPVLLFDGDCAFCTASVNELLTSAPRAQRSSPWQQADLATLGVSEWACQESIQWFAAPGCAADAGPGGGRGVAVWVSALAGRREVDAAARDHS